jgi:hypothetical protein
LVQFGTLSTTTIHPYLFSTTEKLSVYPSHNRMISRNFPYILRWYPDFFWISCQISIL